MPECIVIGGGVIGMLTARELYKSGTDVLLIERGPLGGESSWAGGGIISPLYPWRYQSSVNVLAQRSKELYPGLAAQLTDESGVDCELLTSGLFITDLEELDQAMDWSNEWNINLYHLVNRKQVQEVEPVIVESVEQGLWLPDIMQIRNPKVVQALQGSFNNMGIAYSEHTRVDNISIQSGRVIGVQCDGDFYNAEKVIVASGAWSAGLVKNVQKVDVEPVKGQMIMLKGEPNLINRIILSDGHYVIPRRDGRVLAGSTLEKSGFDKSTSDTALQELRENAVSLVPALADYPVERQWAGLRPGTKNGIPYICASDEVEGLYVHAGHYRNGIVLGPASVQLMVELVLGRETFCAPSPYSMTASH
jgi:glycine oxidase